MVDVSKINQVDGVVILDSPSPNSREFNLSNIASQHVGSLDDQNRLLGNLTSFGEGEIKSRFLSSVGTKLDSYIAGLPVDSKLAGIYNLKFVQSGLSYFGIAPTASGFVAEGFLGNAIASSGLGRAAVFIQAKTGINLGVKMAAKAGAKVVEKAALTGGEVAVEGTTGVGIAATVTAALAPVLGPLAPVVGAIVGFLVDVVGAKIIEWISSKIPWKKIAPWLIGGGVFLVAGPIAGVTVGIGTLALVSGVNLGVIGLFFRALGGSVYERVIKIFIITFILFCVTVIIVLFIINSGAYVVPPTSGTFVSCGGDSTEKPTAADIIYSNDGKYVFPLANAHNTSLSCTHWDKSLATDIFTAHTKGDHYPVLAYTSGTIFEISLNDSLGGKYIILKGNDGRYYYYAHNCTLYVKSGDPVRVGDVIATTDNTGSAAKTAEHSHFAISNHPNFTSGGTFCPSKEFEEKFNLGKCNSSNECVP
jgi:hypothetical protein